MLEDLVVYRANAVRTMDPGRPLAAAVAVMDGRIVSAGTVDAMAPWLARFPHRFNDRFRDQVIFPGFIDSNTHFRMSGVFMSLTYVGPIP